MIRINELERVTEFHHFLDRPAQVAQMRDLIHQRLFSRQELMNRRIQ